MKASQVIEESGVRVVQFDLTMCVHCTGMESIF